MQRLVGQPLVWRLSPFDVTAQPVGKSLPTNSARRYLKDHLGLFIHTCADVMTIQDKKGLQSRMTGAFVAIDEGVILDQREPESGCFLNERRIEFCSAEGHAGLGYRGLQRAQITNADQAARLLHDATVDVQHFANCEIAHLGKPLIEFGVLVQHVLDGLAERFFGAREQVIQTDTHEFFGRDLELTSFLA